MSRLRFPTKLSIHILPAAGLFLLISACSFSPVSVPSPASTTASPTAVLPAQEAIASAVSIDQGETAATPTPEPVRAPTALPSPVQKDCLQINEALAVELAMKSFGRSAPEVVIVEDAYDPVARLMLLSEYQVLQGVSSPDSSDFLVWVVEAEGAWGTTGIMSVESCTTFHYASVAIDAHSGSFIGSSRTQKPLLGRDHHAPLVTPLPTPPPLDFQGRITFSSNRTGNYEIYTMNANGSQVVNVSNNNNCCNHNPVWSPDGSQIAFTTRPDELMPEVYVMNSDGTDQTNLTSNAAVDSNPAWAPDGSRITFSTSRDIANQNPQEIYVMNVDGSNAINLTNNPGNEYNSSWSPDGSKIAFESTRDQDWGIYVMNADGTNPVRLTNSAGRGNSPAWSPDGNKIAFEAKRDGNVDIYVMNADGSNQVRLTSDPAYDQQPAWSPDGTKIAFISSRYTGGPYSFQIYIMNSDGSTQTKITDNSGDDLTPSWAP